MYSGTVLSLNMDKNFLLKSGLRVETRVGPAGATRTRISGLTIHLLCLVTYDLLVASWPSLTQGSHQSQTSQGVEGGEHSPQGFDPHWDGPVCLGRVRPLWETPGFHQHQVLHSVGEK